MTAHITDETDLQRLAFLGKLEPEDLLCELLATIQGDGGHHADAVGLARAVFDAEKKIAALAPQQPSQGAEEPVAWLNPEQLARDIVQGVSNAYYRENAGALAAYSVPVYTRPAPEASGAMPLSEEQRKDVLCAALCISARGDDSVVLTERDAERIVELLTDIAGFDLSGISATSKETQE